MAIVREFSKMVGLNQQLPVVRKTQSRTPLGDPRCPLPFPGRLLQPNEWYGGFDQVVLEWRGDSPSATSFPWCRMMICSVIRSISLRM